MGELAATVPTAGPPQPGSRPEFATFVNHYAPADGSSPSPEALRVVSIRAFVGDTLLRVGNRIQEIQERAGTTTEGSNPILADARRYRETTVNIATALGIAVLWSDGDDERRGGRSRSNRPGGLPGSPNTPRNRGARGRAKTPRPWTHWGSPSGNWRKAA